MPPPLKSSKGFADLHALARRASRRAEEADDLLQSALLAAIEAGRTDFASPETRRWLAGVGTFSESQKVDGVIGGFQSGYNYQFGQWVLGLETDIQASGQKGGTTLQITALPVTTLTTDHKLTWFGTSRTRLGVLWSPNVLLYGTAGVAYGQVKDTATITAPGASVVGTFKDVKAGWTAGAGVEGNIGGGWTAKLEYLYIDLGKTEQTLGTPALGQVISETRRFTDNIVRVGFNYRWGGGAY